MISINVNGECNDQGVAVTAGALRAAEAEYYEVSGRYFAATNAVIVGSAVAAQHLISIEMPVGCGYAAHIRRWVLRGAATGAMATAFLYRVARATGLPTTGTILTSVPHDTRQDRTPSRAIVRISPTGLVQAAGDLWVGFPGCTAANQIASTYIEDAVSLRTDLRVHPGECLFGLADLNNGNMRHWSNLYWDESPVVPPVV